MLSLTDPDRQLIQALRPRAKDFVIANFITRLSIDQQQLNQLQSKYDLLNNRLIEKDIGLGQLQSELIELNNERRELIRQNQQLESQFRNVQSESIAQPELVNEPPNETDSVNTEPVLDVSRGPKLPEPEKFENSKSMEIKLWLDSLQVYFETTRTREAEWAVRASLYLSGEARVWLFTIKDQDPTVLKKGWEHFKSVMIKHFEPVDQMKQAFKAMFNLTQTHSVRSYIDQFVSANSKVPSYKVSEDLRILVFADGLKQFVQAIVNASQPTTLNRAYELALTTEDARSSAYNGPHSRVRQPDSQRGHSIVRTQSTTFKQNHLNQVEASELNQTDVNNFQSISNPKQSFNVISQPSKGFCYNCGAQDHWSNNCPKPRRIKAVPRVDRR